ncbi:MAG: exodeoxyribonuclease III [Actinomycetaceae bacterium]|nr:exodeoxyribonuclease III [Actinomycetaceae bacterium]
MLRITTVNVNGIRAAARKGFIEWLEVCDPDVLALQEVRADADTTQALFGPGWDVVVHECRIKGRAGVALAVRSDGPWALSDIRTGLPADFYIAEGEEGREPDVDSGRWLEASVVPAGSDEGAQSTGVPALRVVSTYLHSGAVGTQRQDQKMAHLPLVSRRLDEMLLDAQAPRSLESLVIGDFNIVRSAADIKNWKPNHNKSSGVLDEEIAFLDAWMGRAVSPKDQESKTSPSEMVSAAWVDVMRHLAGDVQGPYTWWSNRGQAFTNDAGWRIDYHMASRGLAARAQSFEVGRADSYEARWSDHAPVTVGYSL